MSDIKKHEIKRKQPQKGAIVLMQLHEDVRALNTAVTLLSQKMKHLIRNEKILGRNLVILNKKFKELSEARTGTPEASGELSDFASKLKELNEKIESLSLELNELKTNSVSAEDLKEMKYIVDSINPLEYVTVEQAKAMIEEKLGKKKPK